MTYETLLAYEEYCMDCHYEGRSPKPIWAWLEGKE